MKRLLLLGTVAGALAFAMPASAHGPFSLHVGVPGISVNIGVPPLPIVVHRAPICAPPAIVYAPPRVYVRPAPVVLVPPRIVLPPPPVVVYRPHHRYVVARPFCR